MPPRRARVRGGKRREDGYLTLRRVPGRVAPLFDQQVEGQRVTVQGRRGAVPGVVAVRSIHLTRGREAPSEAPFTVDDAYVDVGAQSAAGVTALGIGVLAPVTLAKRPHRYGTGCWRHPAAGRRAACAALVLAVETSRGASEASPAGDGGVRGRAEPLRARSGHAGQRARSVRGDLLLDGGPGARGALAQAADAAEAARWPGLGRVNRWSLPVRYAGTAVETVAMADADSLREALVRWIGGGQ